MIYTVTVTPKANADLKSIYEYIAYELQSPQSAKNQLVRLEKNIYSLSEFPERFRTYDKEPWKSRNLRVMPVDNYLVFYIPNRETCEVTVLRVMFGGRNVENRL